jgi:hypothetical protein
MLSVSQYGAGFGSIKVYLVVDIPVNQNIESKSKIGILAILSSMLFFGTNYY